MKFSYRIDRVALIVFGDIVEQEEIDTVFKRWRFDNSLVKAKVESFFRTQAKFTFQRRQVREFRLIFVESGNVKNLKGGKKEKYCIAMNQMQKRSRLT